MKKRLLLLIAPIITLILEALPFGVKMDFATAEGTITRYTSYFDTMPYGYAKFSPLITAILSCVILTLMIIYCYKGKRALLKTTKVLLYIATVLSVCPFLTGFCFGALLSTNPFILGLEQSTIVGVMVTLSFVIELIAICKVTSIQ